MHVDIDIVKEETQSYVYDKRDAYKRIWVCVKVKDELYFAPMHHAFRIRENEDARKANKRLTAWSNGPSQDPSVWKRYREYIVAQGSVENVLTEIYVLPETLNENMLTERGSAVWTLLQSLSREDIAEIRKRLK